LHELSFIINN